jgi:hypothetical protein
MYAANTKTKPPQDACACTGNHGHVTVLDVRRVVDGLNTRKANLERIPVAVLQCVSDVIAEPLAFIYNMVLGTDIIPQYLKSALVIPLHKGGSRELASNYRPISVISVFGTIFEKLIAPPIYSYVSERNLLPDRQFGFRKGMSCISAATLLLSSVVDRLDSNRVAVLFVDIKNAFPSTDHDVLRTMVSRLNGLGVCPSLLASYLENRQMHVRNGSACSDTCTPSRGVPQGSVLAPLLFNLYYSDVINSFPLSDIILYADDTAVISSSADISSTLQNLQKNAYTIESSLAAKLLSLNASKSYYMLFCAPSALCSRSIKLSSGEIHCTSSFKYLGIWFDADLSFDTHCTRLISKLKSQLYIILRYPHRHNWQDRRILFYAHIYPFLLYGIECYLHCNITVRQRLERLYRRCGNIVLGNPGSHGDLSMYSRLHVLPLRFLFQLRGALFMFKIIRLRGYTMFRDYFAAGSRSRCAFDLILPVIHSERCRKSFRYWGAKLWNSIPSKIRAVATIKQFETLYESYLETRIPSHTDAYDLYDFI